jgi:tetratricopeptide (TPR) repeat protein
VAEFLLYGRTDYKEVLEFASTLREAGERSEAPRAIAFAAAVSGEAHLLSGDLDKALPELEEAIDLHHQIGANAGEALSLQRLAETHLELGNKVEARRLLTSALPLARWSPIAHHLIQRIYGTMIRAADDPETARALVDQATSAIGPSDMCVFCTVMIAIPSSIACSAVGDIEEAEKHLFIAEMSAMAWQGTAWTAAAAEARGHIAAATGRAEDSAKLFDEAASLFAQAGQPLDEARCRSRLIVN